MRLTPATVVSAALNFALVATVACILLVGHAHAQAVVPTADPVGLVDLLTGLYPPVTQYVPVLMFYFMVVCGICAALTAFVPAPTTASSPRWITAYKIALLFAARWRNGLPAVPPNMQPEVAVVQRAAAVAMAAAPQLATAIAAVNDVAGQTVINLAPPASSSTSPAPAVMIPKGLTALCLLVIAALALAACSVVTLTS